MDRTHCAPVLIYTGPVSRRYTCRPKRLNVIMSDWTISRFRHQRAARRLLTILLLGWLGLALQPCSAASASPCVNCPAHQLQSPCSAVADEACSTADAVAAKPWPVSGDQAVSPAPLLTIMPLSLREPPVRHLAGAGPPGLPTGSGPSLNIRFCSLSN